MIIIINAASIYKGGAEQVVNSFINECRGIEGNEYHIFLCDNIMSRLDPDLFSERFHFYVLEDRPGKSFYNLYKTIKYFKSLEKKIDPDIVISTGGHGYWMPDVPLIAGFNIPHYVYPESPYFNKISLYKKAFWKLKKTFDLHFYKQVSAIVVQTDDVNQRVKSLLPKKNVFTISNTVNGVFLNPPQYPKKLNHNSDNEIRLLSISSFYPHKNLGIIKRVLDELFEKKIFDVKFIITITDHAYKENFSESKYQNNIINVGPVSIDECPSLYEECDFMFLPTLLECFSASYVEAMAMKKPILTSDLGFARTICEDAAIYFDPNDESDIADKILNVARDEELQKELISNGSDLFRNINSPRERALKFLSIAEVLLKNEMDSLKKD